MMGIYIHALDLFSFWCSREGVEVRNNITIQVHTSKYRFFSFFFFSYIIASGVIYLHPSIQSMWPFSLPARTPE